MRWGLLLSQTSNDSSGYRSFRYTNLSLELTSWLVTIGKNGMLTVRCPLKRQVYTDGGFNTFSRGGSGIHTLGGFARYSLLVAVAPDFGLKRWFTAVAKRYWRLNDVLTCASILIFLHSSCGKFHFWLFFCLKNIILAVSLPFALTTFYVLSSNYITGSI